MFNKNLRAFSFVNQADPKGSDNQDCLEILKECNEIECLPMVIGCRKSFPNSSSDGLSVVEMKVRDEKAISEINELYKFVYNKYSYVE